jgi:hypothetical protein
MPGQFRYWTKPGESGIFSVRYRTEIIDAGMPMPALVFWISMPSYGGANFPAMSPPGPAGVWPASGARFTATQAWPPAHLHPAMVFSSPPCRFGGLFAVQ